MPLQGYPDCDGYSILTIKGTVSWRKLNCIKWGKIALVCNLPWFLTPDSSGSCCLLSPTMDYTFEWADINPFSLRLILVRVSYHRNNKRHEDTNLPSFLPEPWVSSDCFSYQSIISLHSFLVFPMLQRETEVVRQFTPSLRCPMKGTATPQKTEPLKNAPTHRKGYWSENTKFQKLCNKKNAKLLIIAFWELSHYWISIKTNLPKL